MGVAMGKEINRMIMEKISFHLLEALQLCSHLDLSGLGPLEQKEWTEKIKLCKNALDFTKDTAEKLSALLSS